MNRILFCAILVFLAVGAGAQTAELTGRTWRISEDQMTGVGKHESLAEGTTLTFNTDGTWMASAPLRGATQGTWLRAGGDQLRMTFGDDPKSRKVKLLVLTGSELRFRLSVVKAVYTYTWRAE